MPSILIVILSVLCLILSNELCGQLNTYKQSQNSKKRHQKIDEELLGKALITYIKEKS